jgi:hypothetical protein
MECIGETALDRLRVQYGIPAFRGMFVIVKATGKIGKILRATKGEIEVKFPEKIGGRNTHTYHIEDLIYDIGCGIMVSFEGCNIKVKFTTDNREIIMRHTVGAVYQPVFTPTAKSQNHITSCAML